MENKLYRVNVEFNAFFGASFDAVQLETEDNCKIFARSEEGCPVSSYGFVRIDEEHNKIGLLYDIFSLSMSIDTKKEVDGNLHYVCTNGLSSRIDLYVVDSATWIEKGQSLFLD